MGEQFHARVRVHEVHRLEELAEHGDAWDALAWNAREQSPMLSYAWVSSFLQHRLAPEQAWRCLFAYAGDDLVGVAPVVSVRSRVPGSRWQGTDDAHTRTGHPLLDADHAGAALTALVEQLGGRLVGRRRPRSLWARFSGIRSGSPLLPAVRHVDARSSAVPAARGSGSVVPTTGAVEDFDRALRTNVRRNLRKAGNRARRDHGLAYRLHTGPDTGNPDLLRTFVDLEAAGWKGAAGTAIARSPGLLEFYRTLTTRLAERGWLEWHFVELDGVPVAGHLAVRCGRSLALVKIGYDEAYSRLGPGNLLFHETVTRVHADDGVDEVNCVTDMDWHDNWPTTKAEYNDVVVAPRGLLPTLAAVVEVKAPAAVARSAKEAPWLVDVVRRTKGART